MDPHELIKEVTGEVESIGRSRPVTVAIDGPVGSGQRGLADRVAVACRSRGRTVVRISEDDFLQPPRIRYRRGNQSPEGYYEDTFDAAALRHLVLEPLTRGDRCVVRRIHDPASDVPVDEPGEQVPDDAVVIVDGTFLLKRMLREYWDLGILLEIDPDERERRAGNRDRADGEESDGVVIDRGRRRSRGYALYLAQDEPAVAADIVIDYTDGLRPVPIRWP